MRYKKLNAEKPLPIGDPFHFRRGGRESWEFGGKEFGDRVTTRNLAVLLAALATVLCAARVSTAR